MLAEQSAEPVDPWEGFNRKMFAFDMTLDRYLLKPAAITYQKVTPGWGERMVGNFFGNLSDAKSALNALLQARFAQAGSNFARVLLNTTLGIGGLFDVASDANLKRYEQDFGLTLARWGVDRGPYLVLPFWGPSTVRDAAAIFPGNYMWPPHYLENQWVRLGLDGLYGVSKRAELLALEKSLVGDKYIFVRNYYLQSRAQKAGKAPEHDDFGASLGSGDGWGEADSGW